MADDAVAPDRELTASAERQRDTPPTDTEAAGCDTGDVEDATHHDAEPGGEDGADAVAPKPRISHIRLATLVGLVVVVALVGLVGWLGYRSVESRKAQDERDLFLQVGRQGALNLTTIDWQEADTDVQRILSSATGTFYDDFSKRSQPFIDVVKQAESKSVGTITAAGLESATDTEAQVLLAVTVKTSNAGAPEQDPRSWRMRIFVQKVGDGAKVSDVAFVP